MNSRNSASKRKEMMNKAIVEQNENNSQQQITNTPIASKTRKKREELSISATKSIKKEKVEIVLQFN